MAAIALFVSAFLMGVIVERLRKAHDLRLDADRGVTFLGGVPYVFRRYGPEQNYETDQGSE